MRFRVAIVAAVGVWGVAVWQSAARAQEPATKAARSVADGVYTDEQAKRGEMIYGAECLTCHGTSMEGQDMAPPLTGGAFMANWNGLSVGDLFERIRVSMPDGNPGKLTRPQVSDVVAYMLRFSKFPAGKAELPRETEVLKQIKIVPAAKP